jgi:acetylornithine deacetylase
MLAAAQQFSWDDLKRPLYVVITADEEIGGAGARHVVSESTTYREIVSHGTNVVVGEPTSLDVVFAHKGLIKIKAIARGKAAHSSTREGVNANLAMIPFLAEMKKIHEDTETQAEWKNTQFQPSTLCWNICVRDGSPAMNITPAKSTCTMLLRTMPDVNVKPLIDRTVASAKQNDMAIRVERLMDPFWSDPQSDFVIQSLRIANRPKPRTVPYGTDGGLLTEISNKIVFGPGNIAQAHTPDEWIALEQLHLGTEMYAKMIRHWCCD